MLSALSIRNIVLIHALDIDFERGLTVLSGETGAGKSILLDSLSLALGARGDGDLVRVGQSQGQVSAVFDVDPDHNVFDFLQENGLLEGDEARNDGIILRRTQSADGRTRGYVNDQAVSVSLLKAIGQQLVEIHGQHEERAMVDAAAHRDLVDVFGGLHSQVEAVSTAYKNWRDAARSYDALKAKVAKAAEDAEYLRASVDELNLLSPKEGEEEELAGKRQTMMAAEKIAGDINEAYEVLAGPGSPTPTLVSAMRKLERKADAAPGLLTTAIEAFGVALDGLSQAESELETALRLSEFDPRELEMAEERLFALRAASRKYNIPVEGLQAHAAKLASDLDDLDAGEGKLRELQVQAEQKREELVIAAKALSKARSASGEKLASEVMKELPALKLDQARFFVQQDVNEEDISAEGCDSLEFFVQTNPGTRPGAMMKVASGGELSRFLLALKVALADRGSAPTLVFDEIDTGVGGAVADAIGARLASLSRHVQVLSVTHAPQVAGRAGSHMLISKAGSENIETSIHPISGDERLEEMARMLSGAEITDEARAAATRLLAGK